MTEPPPTPSSGSLLSPPPTPSYPSTQSTSTANAELSTHLDALYTIYLNLLDTYTMLRAQLSTELSSGFLSLAQAQRSTTLGAGRRYGEECYDERMKAERVVRIRARRERDEKDPQKTVTEDTDTKREEFEAKQGEDDNGDLKQAIEDEDNSLTTSYFTVHIAQPEIPPQPNNPSAKSTTTSSKRRDPLRMFGILTPPALRSAQISFAAALTTSIPPLLNTTAQLLSLEDEIRRVQGKLESSTATDISEETRTDSKEATSKEADSPSTQRTSKPDNKIISSPSKKKALVSRPSEPRSRILKID